MSTEDRSATWLESIRRYVQETDTNSLDLQHYDLTLTELKSILKFLDDSQVSELDVSHNNFENQAVSLSESLSRTKLKKLNLTSCKLGFSKDYDRTDALSLFEMLKDSPITSLNFSGNSMFLPYHAGDMFNSYLEESHLTELNLSGSNFSDSENVYCFINAICKKSSITHLNVDGVNPDFQFCDEMVDLFLNLKKSSITHLSAACNCLYQSDFSKLGDSLRESKLVELDLSNNSLEDDHIDELCEALVGTQVTTLTLGGSRYDGSNNLFRYLKQTKIEKLDLRDNEDTYDENMFDLPHFLSGTSVVSLDIQQMGLTDELGVKIMKSLKSSKLEELHIGNNQFKHATLLEFARIVPQTSIVKVSFGNFYSPEDDQLVGPSLSLIGDLLAQSQVKHVDLTNFQVRNHFPDITKKSFWGKQPLVFAKFLERVRNSTVTSLKLRICQLDKTAAQVAFPNLIGSKLTHLDLRSNQIGRGLSSLASKLKFTVITDLNLKENYLSDEDVKILAESLKQTRITTLNLGRNSITNRGAKYLALSLEGTDILTLKLWKNGIGDKGMKDLAENAAKTLITTLKVGENPGNMRIVETVIWDNRRFVSQLVNFFKLIAPEPGMNHFRFEEKATSDVGIFLEECLNFYIMAIKHSSTPFILSQEASFALGRDQIKTLLFDEFPKQFVKFVDANIFPDSQESMTFFQKLKMVPQFAEFLPA